MANTPQKVFMGYSSGKTCWFMSFHPDGRVFDAQALAWVTFVLANLADYFMSYTEKDSTGLYIGAYPDGTELDVLPTEVSYQQSGVTPALPADLPIIGIGQSQGSNVAALNYSVEGARNLSKSSETIVQGVVQAGANTTGQIVTDFVTGVDNLYRGRVIIFTSGDMTDGSAIILGYNDTTKILTFTQIPTAPSPGDTFVVV